jgi:hypothetical protein
MSTRTYKDINIHFLDLELTHQKHQQQHQHQFIQNEQQIFKKKLINYYNAFNLKKNKYHLSSFIIPCIKNNIIIFTLDALIVFKA